jgi:hypothetical protein
MYLSYTVMPYLLQLHNDVIKCISRDYQTWQSLRRTCKQFYQIGDYHAHNGCKFFEIDSAVGRVECNYRQFIHKFRYMIDHICAPMQHIKFTSPHLNVTIYTGTKPHDSLVLMICWHDISECNIVNRTFKFERHDITVGSVTCRITGPSSEEYIASQIESIDNIESILPHLHALFRFPMSPFYHIDPNE